MNFPGPYWKVARVQSKGTQNDRFSCFILPIPPTCAHPFHRPLPLFPILLPPTHSLPFANRTQSVIPAHSVLGFPPSLRHDPVGHSGPLGLLRVGFLSLLPPRNLGSVGHSGPLSPLLPPYLLSLLSSMLFHHCLDSVSHSGSLGLWLPAPGSSSLHHLHCFVYSLDSVGHSGPLGLWLPFHLFSLLFSWFLSCPTTALTQSVTPAHSVSGNLISFSFSRFSLFRFTFACTQSVIPAHSVFGFLPLALLLSIFFTVFHSLDSVGHSGPLGLWLPFQLFSLLFSWFLWFPTTALTQSVIPAHSVYGNLISFSFFRFPLFFFTLACTQSVIPAGDSCGKGGTSDDLCLPYHLACLFLPSRLWAFRSLLWTLMCLTWWPDIFPSTH